MAALFHLIVAFLLHKNGLGGYMILSLTLYQSNYSSQSQSSSLSTVKGPISVNAVQACIIVNLECTTLIAQTNLH